MKRSLFTSTFSPMRAAVLGGPDPLAERAAAKKAAMDRICALTSDWRKATSSADKTAWKKSIQQALTAYANKFYEGDVSALDFRTDIILELDRCVPKELIPADWVRKWEAIWNQLDRPSAPSSRPAAVTPSRPARPSGTPPQPTGRAPRQDVMTPSAPRPQTQMTPTASLRPSIPTAQAAAAPQYSIDLQRQLDSYSQKLQDFYGAPTPTAAVQPATPTAPVSMAPTRPRDPYDLTPRFQAQSNQYNLTPASMRPSVASCPQGQIPDGRGGCRSVGQMPSLPGGIPMGPSASVAPMQLAPTSMPTSFMGRRVALRGVHSNGNLEWWGYQQSFLPELWFARPRVRRATLGVGKPVPPGICCQATPDGGAICSTGQGFPPTCPNKPEPNVPGVAEYIQQGGYMVPKPPPAPVNGACGGAAPAEPTPKDEGGGIAPVVGIAAVGALVYAVVEGLL